jgi:hypothetical protein
MVVRVVVAVVVPFGWVIFLLRLPGFTGVKRRLRAAFTD